MYSSSSWFSLFIVGTIEFDLTAIPKGTKTTFLDTTNTTTATPDPMDSLFEKKRIRRWWSLDDDRVRETCAYSLPLVCACTYIG